MQVGREGLKFDHARVVLASRASRTYVQHQMGDRCNHQIEGFYLELIILL